MTDSIPSPVSFADMIARLELGQQLPEGHGQPVMVDVSGDFTGALAGRIQARYGRYGYLEFDVHTDDFASGCGGDDERCGFAMTRQAALALAEEIRRMCGGGQRSLAQAAEELLGSQPTLAEVAQEVAALREQTRAEVAAAVSPAASPRIGRRAAAARRRPAAEGADGG